MQWQDIQKHYPRQWLLLEALKAHGEGDKRILDQLAVLDTYTDSTSALQAYKTLHSEAPERELYVFHTSRDTLDVTERRWLGVRGLG
jgi:hypothetical protein